MIACNQLATDRIADQSGNRDDGEERAGSDADFADVGYLGDEGGCEGDEGAAPKAEEGGEDDDGGVGCGGKPEG